MSKKRKVYNPLFVDIAKENGIPCSTYAHRVLDLGWDEHTASTKPLNNEELSENKQFSKYLVL